MQWEAFKAEATRDKMMLLEARTESPREKINECNKDTKKLYILINNLTNSKTDNQMPDALSDKALVNTFADYFMEKISKIRDELHSHPEYSPQHRDIDQLVQFHPVSAEHISKEMRQMASKSCELDPIPTTLLKRLLPWIIDIITDIINESITTGIFPMEWKIAIIRLLLKKLGLTLIHHNYRPVSNLPFLSKVVEKVVLHQFRTHCDNHRLIPDYQSAYHANYSCETALLKIMIYSGLRTDRI